MSVFCTVSGIVTDANGLLAGAVISISRAIVDNARSTTYETSTTSASDGSFSFTVPQGSRIRFASDDVSPIDGWNYNVPNSVEVGIGNFAANQASGVGVRNASNVGSIPSAVAAYVSAREYGDDACRKTVLTLVNLPITLVKNGTTSGGGGTKIYTHAEGSILPLGGTTNLTVANALDKSFLAAVGSTVQGTGGSLATTTSNMLPSTAATTSSGVGTCKMKSTVSIPVPGTPLDGTGTAIPVYLNACLNADATGAEALTFSGTITLVRSPLGDN